MLDRPTDAMRPLLVAGRIRHHGNTTEVRLVPAPPERAAAHELADVSRRYSLRRGSPLTAVKRSPRCWPMAQTLDCVTRRSYLVWLDYSNPHGPINTGITAAVERLEVRCADNRPQMLPIVMPHSEGWQASTSVHFEADAGALLQVLPAAGVQHE